MAYIKSFFLLNIFFAFVTCFTSCDKLTPGDQKLEFYYYPSKNVYYDVANNQYAYSVNGGKSWSFYKLKNNIEPATLGHKQIIYTTTAQPWDSNEVHRKLYSGSLIAVADIDTSLQTNTVSDKKIIKKAKPVVQPIKPEQKKPNFFKRLFGRKHQQQNEN